MDGDPSSLAALEGYLTELFSGGVSNERLHKIHGALEGFSRQKGAWRDCLYFLNHTTKNETAMYCLTVLEGFITKGWTGLLLSEQKELRNTLNHWIRDKHQQVPFFIRNKAVQLVVHVARSDWPQAYPEFYNEILHLISSSDAPTAALGLLFLQTTSEELGTPRDDLLSDRKVELKQRLLQLVPSTLSVLSGLLEGIWENKTHSITSTPPPSPTQVTPTHSSSQSNVGSGNKASRSLSSELEPLARSALQCLTQFFSWIPLSNHVTPHLMELIFRFVGMGTQPSLAPLATSDGSLSVPVVALGTINEVLYKNCVPAEFEDFVVLLFNNACIILHHLVENTRNSHLPQPIHPQFIEKFLELIHLLVSHHLRRLEGRQLPLFSVPQFLSLFFTFTFDQTEWSRYITCLDTWQVFLDYIRQTSIHHSPGKGDSAAHRYHDSLTTLSQQILNRILFVNNATQLKLLDDEAQDGDMETEWQKVLRQSIEIFVSAGEIVNNQTLSILNEPFERCVSAYQALASMAATNDGVVRIESKSQLKEMSVIFRDLASLLQLIGRLCELHTGKDYQQHFDIGKSLVQRLLDLSTCGTAVANIRLVGCTDRELRTTLIQVHAHCLSALQAWCHWISLWLTKNDSKNQADALINALVAAATDVLSPAYCSPTSSCPLDTSASVADDQSKEAVFRASLQLLSSIIGDIRSPYLWSSLTWIQLYDSVHDIRYLPPAIHRELVRCVLSSAFVAWRNCSNDEQHWEERQARLRNAVDQATKSTSLLLQQLVSEPVTSVLMQGKPSVLATLTLLGDVALLVKSENTASKNTLLAALSPWIEPTLALLSYYIHDHEVTEAIFNFYLAVFDGLLHQIGITSAQKAVQTFLQTFTQQNIQVTLQQENGHGLRAIEQFLRILQIVVQEPGAAFKHFLPSTLTLSLDHIYPSIAQIPSSDLKETFYQLLTMILRHNWRYFFKGSVLTTYGSRELDRSEPMEHQSQFMSIMAAYGQSFLLPDINIFQQNLQSLESLQAKWKLYHKAIFRDAVANQFINTLLDVLANGSHELLREEIGLSIYAMTSPDLDAFFQTILPNFLINSQGIDDPQRLALKNNFSSDTDLPSFTQNIHRLTYDLRCFRIANASRASLFQS